MGLISAIGILDISPERIGSTAIESMTDAAESAPPQNTRQAANEAIRAHEKAIHYMALRFRNSGVAYADLVQEGRVAFWLASRLWRADGGANVWNYARSKVFGSMLRLATANAGRESFDDAKVYLETDERTELRLLVCECLDMLNEHERTVVALFLSGETFEEIAIKLGESDRNVRRSYTSAITTLRERLEAPPAAGTGST